MTPALLDSVHAAAAAAELPAAFVEAVVNVESGGVPWAYKPEPRYHYLWNVRTSAPFRPLTAAEIASELAPEDFPCLAGSHTQEWWAQQASWGLMQVMGAVAREEGYTGLYLSELCDPVVGLAFGCKHLAGLLRWAAGDLAVAAAAYNAGRGRWESAAGQAYAAKVTAAMAALGGRR